MGLLGERFSKYGIIMDCWAFSMLKEQNNKTVACPLKLQALGKLIFYRHIAHVTQQVEKLCF